MIMAELKNVTASIKIAELSQQIYVEFPLLPENREQNFTIFPPLIFYYDIYIIIQQNGDDFPVL
jgi:hypothetical protein